MTRNILRTAPLMTVLFLMACGDIFTVKNPGSIQDDDLNSAEGVNALVVGMSADFSVIMDELAFLVGRAGDEMAGSGSYNNTGLFRRGIVAKEDVNFYWSAAHRARWVAEDGVRRMKEDIPEYSFDNNPLTARAFLLAGLSNRMMGESFCNAVFSTDSTHGAVEPASAHFDRAIPYLNDAITHATGAGIDTLVTAAHGVLAQVYVGKGDWTNAVAHSAMVPDDFLYEAIYSSNSGREYNVLYGETHLRSEMSAFSTLAASFPEYDQPGADPRAPWTNCTRILQDSIDAGAAPADPSCTVHQGADGVTANYQQMKFLDRGAEIPVIKGAEMRLIEAEAALQGAGNLPAFTTSINEARAIYSMPPVTQPATLADAWDLLDQERHLTLWLEGRRMFDLNRWDHDFLNGGSVVYPGEARRASCIPISNTECQVNDVIRGDAVCS